MNEQEWKNNHVTYRHTQSALLFFVLSVILIYLLYKLYTHTSKGATIWFCRKEEPATATDVSCTVGQPDLIRRALLTLIVKVVRTVGM